MFVDSCFGIEQTIITKKKHLELFYNTEDSKLEFLTLELVTQFI